MISSTSHRKGIFSLLVILISSFGAIWIVRAQSDSETDVESASRIAERTLENAQTASENHTPEAEAAFLERVAKLINPSQEVENKSTDESSTEEDPEKEVHHRSIKVKGCGIWVNRMLKKAVWVTLPGKGNRPENVSANFIEDSISILKSELDSLGYLNASIDLELNFATAAPKHYRKVKAGELEIEEQDIIETVVYRVEKGVRFYIDQIEFEGLKEILTEQAEEYFRGPEFLIRLKSNRIYSPDQLKSSLSQLEVELHERGFADAKAEASDVKLEPESGKVQIKVKVNQGPHYLVRTSRNKIIRDDAAEQEIEQQTYDDTGFSETWVMNWLQKLREQQYAQGFAEAQTKITQSKATPADEDTDSKNPEQKIDEKKIYIDLEAETRPGTQFVLGQTNIEGEEKTREKFLLKKTNLEPGSPLNPLDVQEARYRLARTGLFDSVRYSFQEPLESTVPPVRNVTFHLQESKTTEVNLLAGYGSFELLRGGVEWERKNLFGIAHSSRLRLVQAIRASRVNYDYSAPGLFHSSVDGFFSLYARQRDEPAFLRREVGGGIGAEFPLDRIESRMGIRYNMEYLNADDIETTSPLGSPSARVASVSLNWLHDKRDQILTPQSGYHLFTHLETASKYLGGDSTYQRFELGGSWRRPLNGGRFFHFGATHGFILSPSNRTRDLPFNKRFFPGGENSIRGYQVSEASPLDSTGSRVGAETYWLTQVELEQALTPSWSVLMFQDTLGIATDYRDYPSSETLFTLGLGIRWKTIVGPVRLEYGHNLNPRDRDPNGTVLFSIGSPF